MALTDVQLRKLKPTGNEYQVADGHGLVIVVRAKGTMHWRYEYRIDGNSMITQISQQKFNETQEYIMIKYKNQIFNCSFLCIIIYFLARRDSSLFRLFIR